MVHLTDETASASISQATPGGNASLDLQQFCGKPGAESRAWLMKPFRISGHAYATDGVILVRVEAGPDRAVEELASTISYREKLIERIEGYFRHFDACVFSPCPATLPPRARAVKCFDCDGRGHEHDCPECSCECEGCGGAGENDPEVKTTVNFAGAVLALGEVRRVLALPSVVFAVGTANVEIMHPLFFRFEGGIGALMPCTKPRSIHIEIEAR